MFRRLIPKRYENKYWNNFLDDVESNLNKDRIYYHMFLEKSLGFKYKLCLFFSDGDKRLRYEFDFIKAKEARVVEDLCVSRGFLRALDRKQYDGNKRLIKG